MMAHFIVGHVMVFGTGLFVCYGEPSYEPFVLPLNNAITFTARLIEPSSIQYMDLPTGITNEC